LRSVFAQRGVGAAPLLDLRNSFAQARGGAAPLTQEKRHFVLGTLPAEGLSVAPRDGAGKQGE